jgi:hypothetical protein
VIVKGCLGSSGIPPDPAQALLKVAGESKSVVGFGSREDDLEE